MMLYDNVSQDTAKLFTQRYSTSFSLASRLFPLHLRSHIYNIYGLVRVADEIVDSSATEHAVTLLAGLEADTIQALEVGYSANPIVHAFCLSVRRYGIDTNLIKPFFRSMQMDTEPVNFNQTAYDRYIYGSAEVVGLMCLKIFCEDDIDMYNRLAPGAQKLGSAYQKVNFLRDFADDTSRLNRYYFPSVSDGMLNESSKSAIITDIEADFLAAQPYIQQLPAAARPAVSVSYSYYGALLRSLKQASAATISQQRVRVPDYKKYAFFVSTFGKLKLRSGL